jgi:hypothetical protein
MVATSPVENQPSCVGTGKTDTDKKECDLAPRCPQSEVARHGEDRTGANTDAIHRGDDRLRAGAHRLHQVACHLRESEKCLPIARLLHLLQPADDVAHVAAAAEVSAGTGNHHSPDIVYMLECEERIGELAICLESQRILPLRTIECDGGDAVAHLPREMNRF